MTFINGAIGKTSQGMDIYVCPFTKELIIWGEHKLKQTDKKGEYYVCSRSIA